VSRGWRVLLLVATLAGCVRRDLAPSFTPAWEAVDTSQPGWLHTRSSLVVSDCQFHNLCSEPVPERNLSTEAAIATAIRPPQLDLFAPEVLRWILQNGAPDAELVLHLGDALDLACEGEMEVFLEVMDSGGRPWFMAPGNHDSYYFGVFDPQKRSLWRDACHGAGEPLTKERFLRRYLAALVARDAPRCAALARALGLEDARALAGAELARRLPTTFEWHAPSGTPGLLEALAWNLDAERPWRSFVLQAIDISARDSDRLVGGRVFLLDSCQYGRRPELLPNGWRSYPLGLNSGSAGEMLPDQLRLLRSWLEEAGPEEADVLAFHHPFADLAPRTRASLGWLWCEERVSLVVSGHTHRGYFEHHDLGGSRDQLELNVASTTDWPMEWRVLTGYIGPGAEQVYLRAERHTLVDELRELPGYFLPEWELPPDAPDDYRAYKIGQTASRSYFDAYWAFHLTPYWLPQPRQWTRPAARRTEEQVKDTLLWTYERLITRFPTAPEVGQVLWPAGTASDSEVLERIRSLVARRPELEAKIELLGELALFEHSRSSRDPLTGASSDPERVRFKISQAAWASRFESSRGRLLRVEDELIRVRRPHSATTGAQPSAIVAPPEGPP